MTFQTLNKPSKMFHTTVSDTIHFCKKNVKEQEKRITMTLRDNAFEGITVAYESATGTFKYTSHV